MDLKGVILPCFLLINAVTGVYTSCDSEKIIGKHMLNAKILTATRMILIHAS